MKEEGVRSWQLTAGVARDLRVAARMLAKNPGFTLVVVLALALGVGVNAAVFNAVNQFLVRPLAVPEPDRLAAVFMGPKDRVSFFGDLSSYQDYLSIESERAIFSGVVASRFEQFALTSGPGRSGASGQAAELVDSEMVSGNYFQVLGVRAQLGRTFSAEEGQVAAAHPVIVLGHALWQRRFAGDPGIVGRTIYLNGAALTVVGVLPARFKGVARWYDGVSAWVPLGQRARLAGTSTAWITDRSRRDVSLFARLQPGVTLAVAAARLGMVDDDLARRYPASNGGIVVHVTSEIEARYGSSFATVKMAGALAMLVAGLVLLISCANVTNLILARTARRAKEIGIRLALGVSRGRLVRQLLTESLLLALLGGAIGVALSFWVDVLINAFIPRYSSNLQFQLEPDLRVLAWGFGASLVAGLVFGTLPAWRASRVDVTTALKTDAGAHGHSLRRVGLRQALVIAQIAISIVVVVSGGLMFRSLRQLEAVDPGYRTDTLVSATVDFGMFFESEAEVRQSNAELARRLERLPGVRSVSSSRYMPLVFLGNPAGPVVKEGQAPPPPNRGLMIEHSIVYPRYFETVGTSLLMGRDFAPHERAGTPSVAIVNRELARRLFGREEDAVGRRFRIGGPDSPLLQIIGVARDGRYLSLSEEPRPFVFLPGDLPVFDAANLTFRTVLVRAERPEDLPALALALREAVQQMDARIPVTELMAGRSHLAPVLHLPRLAAHLGLILAALALGLAAMGVYSLMTYTVGQRTKEIGIRMALGGQPGDVLRLVLGQGLRMTLVGVTLGGLAALGVSRFLSSLLYRVGAADPLTFAVTGAILIAVALVATVLPARRATSIDPMVSLRS